MKYTRIPANTFKELQLNAGIICYNFDPATQAEVKDEDILGATSGGMNFSAVPSFVDRGEDIDNCPKNMAELKDMESIDVKVSGTFVTVNPTLAAALAAAADSDATGKITPRNTITIDDFKDLWLLCDYGVGGMIAVHIMNALSTGGISIQTTDKAKGKFPFEFTGHYSMEAQAKVPYEIYIASGNAA